MPWGNKKRGGCVCGGGTAGVEKEDACVWNVSMSVSASRGHCGSTGEEETRQG